jgi:hypothetical protein
MIMVYRLIEYLTVLQQLQNLCNVKWYERVIIYSEVERIEEEVDITSFKVLSFHLPKETKEN